VSQELDECELPLSYELEDECELDPPSCELEEVPQSSERLGGGV
jgi:hypothetical protein